MYTDFFLGMHYFWRARSVRVGFERNICVGCITKKKGQIETTGVIPHAVLFIKFHFLFPFRAIRLAKVKSPTKR